MALIRQMMGRVGNNVWIEPPLHVAYGSQISIGDNFYANFNLVVVDDGKVIIGNNVMIAPNVTISTTGHPIDPRFASAVSSFHRPSRWKTMCGSVAAQSLIWRDHWP